MFKNYLASVAALDQVILHKKHIDQAIDGLTQIQYDRNIVKSVVSGVIRNYETLLSWTKQHTNIKPKDRSLRYLIFCGIFQLKFLERRSAAAVIYDAAEVTKHLNREWAKSMVYAVLKRADRSEIPRKVDLPNWLEKKLETSLGKTGLAQCVNVWREPPSHIALRIDPRQETVSSYLEKLNALQIKATRCTLSPLGIHTQLSNIPKLPGLNNQTVYIQDCVHQYIVNQIPKLPAGARVLDACAAPGGKSATLMCMQPDIIIMAIDKQEKKIQRLQQNLSSYPQARVLLADAEHPSDWWDNQQFDAIICDTPCSGSGVIQKHPEVKLTHTPESISELTQTQANLLEKLWPLLKKNGVLLYSTCSILREENEEIIEQFIQQTNHDKTSTEQITSQTFTPDSLHTGGYFALIRKL